MKIFLLALLLSLNVCVASETDSVVTHNMTAWMKKNEIPGAAVHVYTHGEPHTYYFGVESLTTQNPVNEKTIFEVASWTKVLTALIAANEANAGKIKLSDPVTKYLPKLGKNFEKVSLLNLGTHTAGLPFNVSDSITTSIELSDHLSTWTLPAPAGTQWGYSNVSIGLLGDALAAEMDQNINALYQEKLFTPLGMTASGFDVSKENQVHYAQGYDAKGNPVPHLTMRFFPAAGAAKMSAHDAGLFLKAALRLPGTPPNIINAMKTSQTAYFRTHDFEQGLGWVIVPITYPMTKHTHNQLLNNPKDMDRGPLPATFIPHNQQHFDGSKLIDKTGGTYGFRSYIVMIPNTQSGVVVLVNRYVSNAEIINIGRQILLALDEGVTY